jgi:LysR family transcriptional regulator of gallate degradation
MPALPNLRHVRAVVEVAERGSVTAAARALHLSQPAVTQALATMERELGVGLFSRTHRGVDPTPAGAVWIGRARRALAQLREGVDEVVRRPRPGRDALQGITTAQLETLAAIVEHGGFGRAARAGGHARASVHRAARQLEVTLDTALFETTSHGVRPTREAERLARRAGLAASELRQARAELAALSGGDRGGTVVGAMPLARSAIVPHAVLSFSTRHPRHVVTVLDGPYESMLGELRHGRADVLIGALRETPPDDVVQEHLCDDALAIIVRAGHPLGEAFRAGRLPRSEDLARYPWIAPRTDSPLRRHFDRLLPRSSDAASAAPIECNSVAAARAILLASDRATLLSTHQVRDELRSGELIALPHPAGRVVRAIGLTVRRDWRPTAAQEDLLALIRRQASEIDVQRRALAGSGPPRRRKSRGETPVRRVKKRVK